MSQSSAALFQPLELGRYQLHNRVTMAALTRQRAGRSGIPNDLHVEYYSQRASAGLVVTEGTFPAVSSRAFPGQAGIETQEQQDGWQRVAEQVHHNNGLIFMQIMHGGRMSHPDLLEGKQPEAPSALASGSAVHTFEGKAEAPVPRALETEEIPRIVEEFRAAARRAVDAGIDGVEIHGANGYLLHEFLSPGSNHRTDEFGGSVNNRIKLPEMVIRAVAEEIGADRVGVRFSPEHNVQGVLETDPEVTRETYLALLNNLAKLNLAYVSVLHKDSTSGELIGKMVEAIRSNGTTKTLLNTGFGTITDLDGAEKLMDSGRADAVSVGRQLIANPDLVRRWKDGLELNEPNAETFYGGEEVGYTDYPFADESV